MGTGAPEQASDSLERTSDGLERLRAL
ncbi:uncharacterized protein METZ01_LOCUS188989 [marine metagenome]|uniref:Uncharacterized protein n=1 Tax=marine metagenome TaxID=408172 RepID=A0A382DCZ2_9ZZZZ